MATSWDTGLGFADVGVWYDGEGFAAFFFVAGAVDELGWERGDGGADGGEFAAAVGDDGF
jgi:hypothetical protein